MTVSGAFQVIQIFTFYDRVDSRQLEKPYLESVPSSVVGQNTTFAKN
jgi:hypothetical protein